MARKDYQMKLMKTPLSALLGMTAFAAMAPETMGPSSMTAERRTHLPEGVGHGSLDPVAMASSKRGATMFPADSMRGTGSQVDKGEDAAGLVGEIETSGGALNGLDSNGDGGIADVTGAKTS